MSVTLNDKHLKEFISQEEYQCNSTSDCPFAQRSP